MSSPTITDTTVEAMRAGRMQQAKHEFHVIQSAVLAGWLFDCYLPDDFGKEVAIADLHTDDGIWLDEVARHYFGKDKVVSMNKPPLLVGFGDFLDECQQEHEPYVQLVLHDRFQPFDEKWHDKFDVVNIRFHPSGQGKDAWKTLAFHAFQLLKPGGYLHWFDQDLLETESTPPNPIIGRVNPLYGEFIASGKSHYDLAGAVNSVRDSGSGVPSLKIIQDNNWTTGVPSDIDQNGYEPTLEMRNLILHMVRGIDIPQRTGVLQARAKDCGELDIQIQALMKTNLDEFMIQSYHPAVVARKVTGLSRL